MLRGMAALDDRTRRAGTLLPDFRAAAFAFAIGDSDTAEVPC
jgi:hypothetical protein